MIELRGKYAEAKVFTDIVDQESISQVMGLLNQPFAEGSIVRMMPDIHAGAGCTIGTTMTVGDKICPNLVGVDIGCGMEAIRLKEKFIEPQKLDRVIREGVPSGFAVRTKPHPYADKIDLSRLYCHKHIDEDRAYRSIGTLGGGNHFIEANKGQDGSIWLVIHSGSRHMGVEIASHYQKQANLSLKEKGIYAPRELAYLDGELMAQYLHDMAIAQSFAELNRSAIADTIIKGMGFHVTERFATIHNYIDIQRRILRKGAVSAQAGERLLIPMNMRDGSLLCIGKGNPDWNFSAPHGAGRLMSRSAAKEAFTVSEYKKQMEGIFTTSVGRGTLDECPMAYKDMSSIVENIGPTADIQMILRPIYNFKAGAGD